MKPFYIRLITIATLLNFAILLHGQWSTGPISLPSGALILKVSGTCPLGTTENITLNGRTVVGTTVANGDAGTTGGSDTITPAGTISALTFTGSALATHSHELPWQIPSTTTIRQIAVATFGTGTSRAATAVSAAGTANTTSAAVALTESKTAGTPAGTINTPTFTGTQFDNRSQFFRVVVCSIN